MILIREEHNANAIVDSRTFLQVRRKSWRALKTKNSCNMQYYLLSTIFHSNHAQWSCIISWMTWHGIYNQLRLCIFPTTIQMTFSISAASKRKRHTQLLSLREIQSPNAVTMHYNFNIDLHTDAQIFQIQMYFQVFSFNGSSGNNSIREMENSAIFVCLENVCCCRSCQRRHSQQLLQEQRRNEQKGFSSCLKRRKANRIGKI